MAIGIEICFFTLFCIIYFLVYRKRKFHQKCKSIESSSSLSYPPSISSPSSRIWTHQVFQSFRGEDVRKTLLSHIQKEFERNGIVPFIDNEMKRGDSIGTGLLTAIRESKIAIVLLSKNYASSSWCLNELLEIMKCRKDNGQTVMTVFYDVEPSDVRNQTGDFGKAFKKICVGKTEELKKIWRQALMDVSNILGQDSRQWDSEAEMVVKIAKDVSDMLNNTPSRELVDYVGIRLHITKINSLLRLESGDVRMIGILGPPGIGKTTIARVLYNQISENFQFSAFIEDMEPPTVIMIGERQRRVNLQRQLLSETFKRKDVEIRHLGALLERLKDHKVLVVLDGVNQLEQLNAMAEKPWWFGYGSRIIITTQDQKLLKAHGINHVYKVELPPTDEAVQIFCIYAFDQKFPYDGFEALAWEVTELAGKLPLGLRVLGSYLKGMSLIEWKNALPRLRTSLDGEIEKTLRFSYNALSHKDKALFLHIACLFHGYQVDHVKQWLANSGLDVDHGLDILTYKSLISIDMGFVTMHSLLQQLGVEIVRKSNEKRGKRQFLTDINEISDVITKSTGTGAILGIRLNVPKIKNKLVIKEIVFDGMTDLQFLIFNEGFGDKLILPQGLNCLPSELRLLHWNNCPLRSWPSKFSAELLVELAMQGNNFEKLWEETLPLENLKRMELRGSKSLKEIPNLSYATNLEELDLSHCSGLLKLTDSIGNATKLKRLDLYHCASLEELPSSIGMLTNLEGMELSRCYKLVTLPSSIEKLQKMPVLSMSKCENLETFPTNINMESLSEIDLEDCSRLKIFPDISRNIEKLDMRNTAIEEVPSSIRSWSSLSRLDMSGCRNFKKFPNVPDSIVELELSNTGIEEIPPWIENLSRLRTLTMDGCDKLKIISPNISKLQNLEFLDLTIGVIDDNEGGDGGEGVDNSDDGSFYAFMESDSDLYHDWTLQSDYNVHYILPICLPKMAHTSPVSLRFFNYGFKTIPSCIGLLSGLNKLEISGCRKLEALPQLPGSLLFLDAENCESLERLDCSFQNPEICLNFAKCIKLNKEAKELIHTSACEYALLPGVEVPVHFTHRATSDSLTINMPPEPLPSSFRFQACILLSKGNSNLEDQSKNLMSVSCCVSGKQNGLIVRYGSRELLLRARLEDTEHLYIFEDSFSLNQDCPKAKEATLCELLFEFIVDDKTWKVKGCGVRRETYRQTMNLKW